MKPTRLLRLALAGAPSAQAQRVLRLRAAGDAPEVTLPAAKLENDQSPRLPARLAPDAERALAG